MALATAQGAFTAERRARCLRRALRSVGWHSAAVDRLLDVDDGDAAAVATRYLADLQAPGIDATRPLLAELLEAATQ